MDMYSVNLSSPVRLIVDLAPPPGVPRPVPPDETWFLRPGAPEAMEAVVAGGFLSLQLNYPPAGEESAKRLSSFIRLAASRGIAVSVVLADEAHPPAGLAAAGAGEAALDLTTAMGAGADPAGRLGKFVWEARRSGLRAGGFFRMGRRNLDFLEPFLKIAGEAGADFLELPPLPLVYYPPMEAAGAVLGPGDYRRLEAILGGLGGVTGVADMRVHDPLAWALLRRLWRAFPGDKGRFAGCQAAAGLAYVSAGGEVHPCAAIPRLLGRVGDLATGGFWEGEAVAALREEIAGMEIFCAGCRAAELCRGGCPGARLAATGSLCGPDPLCDLFREQPPELI